MTVGATWSVRPAATSDARAMASVWLASALEAYASIFPPGAPRPTLAELSAVQRRDLARPTTRGFVVEDGGHVVGAVTVGAWPGARGVGRLARLYVAPSHWRRGIGSGLYERAEDELRSRAFTSAKLWVLRANARARAMYERRGWNATGRVAMVFGPAGVEDVEYRLQLQSEPRITGTTTPTRGPSSRRRSDSGRSSSDRRR